MTETTPHNLLTDPWLPVRLRGGGQDTIRLDELGRDDIVDIEAPRADFRGAIYQLLIGLLQTTFAPADRKLWTQYWNDPPRADALEQAFTPYEAAFNIDAPEGEPAFMQDLELKLDEKDFEPLEGIIPGHPGENTRKENTDLFNKRGVIGTADVYWMAITLFNFQINTAGGGSGHRVTIRGGGPLTTLLRFQQEEESALWRQLWLNVLTTEQFSRVHGNHHLTDQSAIFPWLAKTRTSEKNEKTFPNDANPLQLYWPMPARIRVKWETGKKICDLSGMTTQRYAEKVTRKNKGVNYSGNWVSPLTPYSYNAKQEAISFKGRYAGESYRHWSSLAFDDTHGKQHTEAARVVSRFYELSTEWNINHLEFTPSLWVFGYDLESAKAKCWYESVMPVFNLKEDEREDVLDATRKATEAASAVLDILKKSLKMAWFKKPKDDPNAKKFLKSSQSPVIDANFWASTEPLFYALLRELVEALDDEERINALLSHWHKTLKKTAFILFDHYALSSLNKDGDLKRVVIARDGDKKDSLRESLKRSGALKALAA